ncbi:uncharacterized protein LOC124168143 [Ischnura elegans]|uniref:uncharacterized protein LOC124168143 n=1 Tax=Ischnura elegans TaxID=197161 RepID=UPI001ED869D2|nr:uncharacterized protein LOC124168143 [Ischnura elegans]
MSAQDLSSSFDRGDLLKALRDLTGREDVELEDGIEVKRATKGVEGFLSLVLRVKTPYRLGDGTKRSAWIVVKCMPKMGAQQDMVKMIRAFPREGTFFEQVFPLLRKVAGGKISLPMPEAYYTKYGEDDDAIFMEDLGVQGFGTPTISYRVTGLDWEHCCLVMDAYGRYHALVHAAEKLLPKETPTWPEACPELARDPVLNSPGPNNSPVPFQGMLEQSVATLIDIAKGLEGLPREVAVSGRMKEVLDNTFVTMRRFLKHDRDEPRILTHGDCWMNNSMFRYEKSADGRDVPVEVKFVDFQVVRYCHPCLDLVYFFFASVRKAQREKHMDSLLGMYHDSFVKSLKSMNVDPPSYTLERFKSDMYNFYLGYGYIIESMFVPMMLLGEDFAPTNAEEFTAEKYNEFIETGKSSTVRNQYESDPNYRATLDEVVRDLVNHMFPDGADGPPSPLFLP